MPYGLKDIELAKLNEVFAANERIERVILYGSRAKGNYKPFSDVDITLEGAELTHTDLNRISLAIDDLLLPYQFDISIFHTLKNEALIDHIRRMGITIYEKKSEWKEYKFSDFVEINPSVKIPKGIPVSFVEMKDLDSSVRYCESSQKKELAGGSRFIDGDTLFARITPCMENGKICQVRNLENGIGFGSTEFHILRGKEGASDSDFVYYLSRWDEVRDHAEHNMEGSSGRQRVPKQAFDNLYLCLPPLNTQRRIAAILSSLDDKIDLLHRENATLERMAETLFRQWFVVEAKEEWEEGTVADFAQHCKESLNPQKHPTTVFQHYSIPAFDDGKRPTIETGENIQSNKYLVPSNCILFSKLNPHKDKRVWLMLDDVTDNAICSTEFQIVKPTNPEYLYFLYGWLTNKENYDEIASGVGGTSGSHQRIDPKSIFSFTCPNVDSETIRNYNNKVEPLFYKIRNNQYQIQTLIQTRDGLLPRLMGGEVKI